jgi:hypothetical protein
MDSFRKLNPEPGTATRNEKRETRNEKPATDNNNIKSNPITKES